MENAKVVASIILKACGIGYFLLACPLPRLDVFVTTMSLAKWRMALLEGIIFTRTCEMRVKHLP